MSAPPYLEREVLSLRATGEKPPTEFILFVPGHALEMMIGVDSIDDTRVDLVAFYRGVSEVRTLVAILPKASIWHLISRDEFYVMTRRQVHELEKADTDAKEAIMKEVFPEQTAMLMRMKGQQPDAHATPPAAALPEGHRGPYA